ncbi:uncharacterized protein B0T15DRAFT_502999 [Chaetomium strumarium]|uniref:F-box domain-containing protein n=1 Tax=Chaetomium strumarium TaxID=1170767 RepID=A0AAJ0GTV0_9PEZI|nr:hypothetical protein B0T15DRAFT_502999 [Chaetomium strumarium]
MAACKLGGLPTEVLTTIFEFFCAHCRHDNVRDPYDEQTLVTLCQVSRYLRDVTQPILYHFFTSEVRTLGPSKGEDSVSNIYRKLLFLRSLVARHDLAEAVRSLHFVPQGRSWSLPSPSTLDDKLFNMSEDLFAEACGQLKIKNIQNVEHSDSFGNYTVIQLIIAHSPKCEFISLGPFSVSHRPPEQEDMWVFRRIVSPIPPAAPSPLDALRKLKEIRLYHEPRPVGNSLESLTLNLEFYGSPNVLKANSTLKAFKRLSFLKTDLDCFGGDMNAAADDLLVRVLPESLQNLTLAANHRQRNLQKQLQELSQSQHLFTELQHVSPLTSLEDGQAA